MAWTNFSNSAFVISSSNRFGSHRLAVQQRARLLWPVNLQAAPEKRSGPRV